jgi:hypothetical protein
MAPRYSVTDSSESEEQLVKKKMPTDKQLERALRNTVVTLFQKGNTDDLTVKRVRLATEKTLRIPDGYFKGHDLWKPRSDQIIKHEVVCGRYR